MKILIADDEEYVRLELRELLLEIRPGLKIDEAVNGTAMLSAVGKISFDAAFIDIKMPGFTGLEAIEKAVARNLQTKWIIISGYSDFQFAKKAISLGVMEYILKPFSKRELEEVLFKIERKAALDRGEFFQKFTVTGGEPALHLVRSAERILRERFSQQIGVAQIADELGVTPNYLSALYKKYTGLTFTRHITNIRMAKSLELLKQPGISVKNVSGMLGYSSSRHFARLFREYYGISPSEYIKNYRN